MKAVFDAPKGLGGRLYPPADKSITHRALMLAAVSKGISYILNPLNTGDCLSTKACLEALGVEIKETAGALKINGLGLTGFKEPSGVLYAGNSGTTVRLLAGLIAGLPLYAVISGDNSLTNRPMLRVVDPLKVMGAGIAGRESGKYLPLSFLPGDGRLKPAHHNLVIASAQVKSALLFASLRCEGETLISGRIDSRDHTERLFDFLNLPLEQKNNQLKLKPVSCIPSFKIQIPGDLSSAAFFITAALISGRELEVINCGLNPTRMGFINILMRMGAQIDTFPDFITGAEPIGSICIRPGTLKGIDIPSSEAVSLIDEIPLIAVMGAFADGKTVVRGASELRVKESDRIRSIVRLINALGGEITEYEDGFAIEGPQDLKRGRVYAHGDHRIAMAAAVVSAGTGTEVEIEGFEAADISYPDFIRDFRDLGGTVE